MTSPRPLDLPRQISVIAAVVFMLIAAMVGTGLLGGTAVQDLQGGALDADASWLAPARSAFSIWSVIYVGLIVYAVWQALPRRRADERQRAIGWWIALTAVLNGVWLVVAQFATLPLTVLAIVVLLAALGMTFRIAVLTRVREDGIVDAVLVDGVTGLHLGWVTLATVANTAAWLTATLPEAWAAQADAWGVGVLVLVAVVGLAIAVLGGWRVAPALAMGWGLAWIAVGRFTGEPESVPVGAAAVAAAVLVTIIPITVAGLRLFRPDVD